MAGKLASGGGKRGRAEVNADPNVIPFIDVMLVLLIIFMIAAPIASVDIQVGLPKSQLIPSRRPPTPTWISLQDRDGVVRTYVMNDEVPINELGTRTRESWEASNSGTLAFDDCLVGNPPMGCRIYIRADTGTPYRNVVRVMNQLQNVGFTRIALVTEDRRR